MNVYFTRIDQLARNEAALDSRHRFMLLDLIEQRRNRWRPRKEVRQRARGVGSGWNRYSKRHATAAEHPVEHCFLLPVPAHLSLFPHPPICHWPAG